VRVSVRALDDLRVLDLSGQVAGPLCAKLLGDFGADVVKVEPPGGEDGRRLAPLLPEWLGPEASAFFLYLNSNKRGVTLDVTTATGAALLRRLVAGADIMVESFAPGTLESLGLGFDALEALRPGIILTSVTPFGQTGPQRDLPANELVAYACSGWASVNGWPEREPLKGSGYQASFQAGLAAFIATMNAVVYRDRTGVGQQADVSILEPSVASFAPGLLGAAYRGESPSRQRGNFARGPVPAADGHFSLTLSRAHFWRDAMNELGLPEYALDERFYEPSYRQEHTHEVAPRVEERIATRGKRELFEALGRLRVVGGMVLTTAELSEDLHVRAREFFTTLEHPLTGTLEYPGAPFKMSETPWALERPAPLLGQHTAEVLAGVGVSASELARLRAAGVV
jgi:crotonobetainyl-CoA:carnitine CoA-transferase CaiB-like acyl-CoA transferase